MFHFSPSGNSSALVPFGFVTRSPELVKEAQVLLLELAGSANAYLGKAKLHPKDDTVLSPSTFDEHFGFSNYCSA